MRARPAGRLFASTRRSAPRSRPTCPGSHSPAPRTGSLARSTYARLTGILAARTRLETKQFAVWLACQIEEPLRNWYTARCQLWRAVLNVPYLKCRVVCAKCGSRGNKIDVRPNWKEQPPEREPDRETVAVEGGEPAGAQDRGPQPGRIARDRILRQIFGAGQFDFPADLNSIRRKRSEKSSARDRDQLRLPGPGHDCRRPVLLRRRLEPYLLHATRSLRSELQFPGEHNQRRRDKSCLSEVQGIRGSFRRGSRVRDRPRQVRFWIGQAGGKLGSRNLERPLRA